MKITQSQEIEIDFIVKFFAKDKDITKEIKEGFIRHTVLGKGIDDGHGNSNNPLINGKRMLDIMIKQWTPDLRDGILGYQELLEDLNHPYFSKVLQGILRGIDWNKRNPKNGFALIAMENCRRNFLNYPTDENREKVSKIFRENKEEILGNYSAYSATK